MGEALESALQVLYPKALKKLGIHPVDIGEIKKINSSSPLDVVLEAEVIPDVELALKKIEKIRISQAKVDVTDEELEKEMQAISDRYTHYHPRGHEHGHHHDENGEVETVADMGVHEGDRVRVNALGYDKK